MNSRSFLAFFLIVLPSLVLAQQEAPLLSLEEAITKARTQSPMALAAIESFKGSREEYRSFRAGLLPRLSFVSSNSGYQRAINPITQNDGTVNFFLQQQGNIQGALQLSQVMPFSGGQLFASSSLNRLYVFGANESWQQSWNSNIVSVGIAQPINQFNPQRWELRIQPLQWKIASQEYVQAMENVAVTTSGLFFDALLAMVNLENARFNQTVNDSIYAISKGRFDVGKIAENELLQSELAAMNARISTANAELEAERTLQLLQIHLGMEQNGAFRFVPPANAPLVTIDETAALAQAKKNNSGFLRFDLQALQRKRELDQAQKRNGLQANVSANFGLNQSGTTLDDAYTSPTNRSVVGFSVNMPLVNWGQQKADIRAARARQKEMEYTIDMNEKQLAQQVTFRVKVFNQLKDQFLVAAKSDTIALRRYDVTRSRYLIGKVDITNLQIAQNEKDSARQGYIRALRQFWTAWYELRQLTLFDFVENKPIVYMIAN
jgi:outer membrane protein TolC